MSLPGYNTAACVIFRGDNPPQAVTPIGQITPVSKAAAMAHMFQTIGSGNTPFSPGDLILQGFGDYDWSVSDVTWPACTIRGMGPGLTRNFSSFFDWDGTKRICFKLSNGTVLEEMSMKQASIDPLGADGTCCGFGAANLSATLRRVALWGREWGLYCWSPDCNLLVEDSTITGGRVCVASENSGDGQNFTIRRSTIIGDASLSQTAPSLDVSNPRNGGILGVVHRGGTLSLEEVVFQIKGSASLPRACAMTDVGGDNSEPSGNTRYELFNCRATVNANGAAQSFDLDVQTDYVRPNVVEKNCWGSAGGGLVRSW